MKRSRWAAIVAMIVVFSLASTTVGAQSAEELREERKHIQEEAAKAAAQVNAAEATADEVAAALEALQTNVDAQEAALEGAKRAVLEAEAAAAAANQAVAELEVRLAAKQAEMQHAAVEAYVTFQDPADESVILGDDPWKGAREEALVGFATGTRLDQLDDLREIASELERQRQIALDASVEAEASRKDVETELAALQVARDRQTTVVAEAEARLEARLSEAQGLAELDAQLGAQIQAEEARVAAALAARAAAAAAAAQSSGSGGSGGGGGGGRTTVSVGASVPTTIVQGIEVNTAIAKQTEGFLNAMAAAGYPLGGGGYRSSDRQISLRRQNCGTSDYAIWEMSPSACSPPTARPGRSDHEQGMAIDFTSGGAAIRSRSSEVFQVMARIAPQYGFVNLPSEPWHWSIS